MSVIQESSNFTINNSILNNIQGNATIIRFGDGILSKSEVEDFLKGVTTLPDIDNKLEKHVLIQSIANLPRAKVAYNDYQSQKKNGLCLKGTRESLLGELGNWLVDPTNSRICVLSGLAGIGKSAIAYTLASRADQLGILGASFFFSRDNSDSKTAEKFFTTLAFQLCVYDKAFAQAIGCALIEERGSAAITKDLSEQLEALILKPLKDVARSRIQPTVIVIDALDECDDQDAIAVLGSLERLVHHFPSFKVLLTTRPQPHLDHYLSSHRVFHLQDIEDKVINNDIRHYLKSSLSKANVANSLPGLVSEWNVSDEEIEYLVTATGKLFIIASTAVRIVLDKTARNPVSQMKVLISDGQIRFNDLESFYTVILRGALPQNCSIKIRERFKTVIGAILFVQEPVPVTVLQHFTLPYSLDDIDAVLKNLESVIIVERQTPRIFHKSFSDFLVTMFRGDIDIDIVSEDQHRRLAMCCFRSLNTKLKRNILGLTVPACFMNNIAGLEHQGISEEQFREKISFELDYACRYWAFHLEGASITNLDSGHEELVQELSIFANEHLPHWFEAMSWIDKLDLASRVLRTVHKLLNEKSNMMELQELFSDGLRFISKFHPIIRQSALHTYHSSLLFTPAKTLLYKRYHKETVHNICRVEGMPENWDDIIAHLNHSYVNRVVFSQDRSVFASLGDIYAKFWDTVTGAPFGIIFDEISVIADGFSTAASYNNYDNTITLYDVHSCISITTINVAPATVIKLAISPDGCRLAAGLSDGNICIWNSKSFDLVARLDRFTWDERTDYCCLAFNFSGDRLVFGSDGGVVLLNGISGHVVAELKHGEYPRCLAFSRGSSRLAYRDESLLSLWDGRNGTLLAVTGLKGLGDVIAVSDDGTLIAVEQGPCTTLWRLNNQNCLEAVDSIATKSRDHYGYFLSSISFHHNDLLAFILLVRYRDVSGDFPSVVLYDIKNRLIIPMEEGYMAISTDNEWTVRKDSETNLQLIKLKEASLRPQGPERHNRIKGISNLVASWPGQTYRPALSSITAAKVPARLAFSQDCLRLISCYKDGTVDLWDTSSTRQLITTLNTSARINLCVFSDDGKVLASASNDGTIRLWDGRNGARIDSFKQKYPNITSIVFLRDQLVARCQVSGDPYSESNISMWDLKTSRHIATVTTDSSKLLESLHNDTMVAYYKERRLSEDIDLTIWDAEKRVPYATIPMSSFPKSVERMVISPDRSKLVIQLDDGNLKSFSLLHGYEEVLPSSRREDLDWDWLPPIRSWHNIPVWLHRAENGNYCVSGYVSQVLTPLLWIHDPANAHVRCVTIGSSMFALIHQSKQGSEKQRHDIVLIRPSPTGHSIDLFQ